METETYYHTSTSEIGAKNIIPVNPDDSELVTLRGDICKAFGITVDEICSISRRREYVEARIIFCFMAKERRPFISDRKIGKLINRDPVSVLRHRTKSIYVREVWDKYCKIKLMGI